MSKKILFMSSAKLTAISIGLLLAVFCTIGMSFRPVYDEDEAAEIVMSGQKRAHWDNSSTNSCTGAVTHKYNSTVDKANTNVQTRGNGYVTISTSETANVTSPASGSPRTVTSGTAAGNTATISWNSGLATESNASSPTYTNEQITVAHKKAFTISATPSDPDEYYFAGWGTTTAESSINNNDNPRDIVSDMKITGYTEGSKGNPDYSSTAYSETYYAFFKPRVAVTITLEPNANGTISYSYKNVPTTIISAETTFTTKYDVTLTATPADGYKFFGWYTLSGSTENYISYANPSTRAYKENVTLYAKFVPVNQAIFNIKGTEQYYYDLNRACSEAASSTSKIVYPINDGVVPAGNCTIPSGVTLLVPYNSANNPQTMPKIAASAALSVYRKLTLVEGVNITVNGTICVGGQQRCAGGGNPSGHPVGACGMIDMSTGGHIELNSGATLYCWGFIKGQDMDQGNNTIGVGTITANSGSKVWEDFAVGDWRGGSACLSIQNSNFFPFQSYFIQNIEVPLTVKNGAENKCYASVNGNSTDFQLPATVVGTTDALFKLSSGATVRKWYDPTTDLMCYELSGTANLDAVVVKGLPVIGDISSADFYLPISSSMHIILTNSNVTISKNMVLQPGAKVEIKQDASITISSKVFLYDQNDWGKYAGVTSKTEVYFHQYKNLTTHKSRGEETSKDLLDDAQMIVDGTLIVTGKLYSTAGGADIMGNGGGDVQFSAIPTTSTTIDAFTNNGTEVSGGVTVNTANLHNENESYTQAKANKTFLNINGRWFNQTDGAAAEKANHTYDFTYISSGAVSGTGGTSSTTDAVYSWDKTGLELRQKWANVTYSCEGKDENENTHYWWQGQGEQATWFYNWTLNSDWHQFMPTATEGMYSGSNNKIYTKTECTWEELGETDVNCLYEIGGVKKALVDGQFIALEPNNNDPAYHAADDATQYYICFEGCNWHAADKYAEAEKAYIIAPDTFIWYDNAWMSVNFQEPFAYTMSETNVPIYYEYLNGEWVLAEPYVRVVDGMEDRSYYFIEDAFTFANSVLRTAPTITILRDISGITTALSYTGANKTCTLDLNGHTITGSVSSMLTINGTGCTFIIEDNTADKKGKIDLNYSYNGRRYAVNVTKGHLKLKSGTISAINTMTYNSSSAKSTTSCAIIVKASQQCTIEGGKVYAQAGHNPFGIYGDGNSSTITIKGGEIIASVATGTEPRGIQVTGGTLNVQGGTIEATTHSSGTTGEGIYVNSAASYFATLNMTGGTVKSTTKTSSIGILVNYNYTYDTNQPRNITAQSLPVANISGGEIQVMNANGATAEGVRSFGTTNISGGKITVRPTTTTAFGVRLYAGKTTISETADIDVSATSTAYGVRISQVNPYKTGGLVYNGTLEMTGGTLTVRTSSTTDAYGVYVGAGSLAQTHANDPSSSTYKSYYAGNYANAGTATISGGVIDVQARTDKAYAVYVAEPVSQSGATGYETATATPNCSITGGKFKVASMTASATGIAATNVSTSTYTISGGYYNNQENVETYTTAPKHVVTLPATDTNYPDYLYKVANAYLVTFKNGDEELQSTYQESGVVPTYLGTEPKKASAGGYSYEFDGWSTTDGGSVVDPLPAVTSAGATYYAHFAETDLRYTIALDASTNGGECATEYIRVVPGTAAGTLPTAAKEGHTFTGWWTAASGGTQLTASTVVSGDITYYAQFTVNSYTLTYALGEGKVSTAGSPIPAKNKTGTQSQSVAYGTAITAPAVTRTGYTFSSWDAIVAATMPAQDVTYTPIWTPNVNTKYTVKHYLQNVDGTYPADPVETQSLTGTTATSVTPAVKSYEGFVSPATQTVTIAANGSTVVTYQYARRHYTFMLDAATNGGTSDLPSIEVIHGATIGAVPPDAQKGCNDFTGWYTKPVGGDKITSSFVIEYDMKTLYAQFSDDVRTYPITYLAGAHGTGTVAVGTKTCGEYATLSSNTFIRDGYAQTGWSLTDGGVQAYALGGTYTANASLTLYPVWAAVTYNLTYEGLNGATNSNPATYTIETATITLANPGTRAGYAFTGWTCGGNPITQIALGSTGDKTITANWSAVTYNLTYEGLNGATNSNPATYTIETPTITLADPGTRADYNFTGWTCGGSPITQITLGSTGDKVITANWELVGYQINFVDEDGTTTLGDYPKTLNPGATVTAPTEPTKAQTAEYTYTFAGWFDGTNTYASDAIPNVTAAATYTATYTATPNVASVKVGSAEPTYYTDFADAWTATNSATGAVTLKLLQDVSGITTSLAYTNAQNCTLDLNNHTIAGTVTKLIDVNASGKTFTIDDSSTAKGGKISLTKSASSRIYSLYITAGTVNLKHGIIYCKNSSTSTSTTKNNASAVYVAAGQKFTMDDGTVESISRTSSYALFIDKSTTSKVTINGGLIKGHTNSSTTAGGIYNYCTKLTINGGHIIGHAYTSTSYGINQYGKSTINGGIIEATNDTTSSKGTDKAYGIFVQYNSSTYNGAITIPSSSTVQVLAKARTNTAFAVYISSGSSSGNTIAGGTFSAKAKTGKTAIGVYSYGTITISGGTFNVSTAATAAYGIYTRNKTTTVSGSPVFNVKSGSTDAYGAFAYGYVNAKGASKASGTIKVNGGTFNVTSGSTTAYGAYAGVYGLNIVQKGTEVGDTIFGQHYMPGIIEITDATFNVKATTTGAYGIVVAASKTESGAVGKTVRIPTATITGGKFNVTGTSKTYAVSTGATNTALDIQGGWYNINTNLSGYVAPTKEDCNYYVLDLPSSELPYKYEVAEAYNITFKDGDNTTIQEGPVKKGVTPAYTGATPTKTADSYTYTFNGNWLPAITAVTADATYVAQFDAVSTETGFWLDIIDVDNTNHKLVVNANNSVDWPAASWPFSINDVKYYANTTAGSPARDEKNRLEINYGNLEPGAEFPITITKDATVTSKHTYIIPQEVKTPVTLSDNAPRSIFVKGTTLTIDGDVETENIYVGDDAKLVIADGATLTADTIFLRTTPDGAAELINQGTISASTQLCYTRIIMVKGQYYQFGLPLPCAISSVKLSDNATLKYQTGWLLRAYSEPKRAAQGAEGKNWETLKAAATIEGGKGYEMYSGSNYYREFYFPVDHAALATNKELTITRTEDGAAGEKNAGWNVLVSPLTYTCNNDAKPEDMAICLMTSSGWEDQTVLEHIAPAQPFAYQAAEAGTISFVSATMPSLAPRHRIAAANEPTRIQWIRLDVKDANGEGDETNIYSHPTRYEQYYQTGIDVAKQSLTAARARLYSSHAYGDMAFAGVSDELFEQGVALTLYSPAAQELTFSLRQNEWLNRLQYVWIIDFETGAMIDLLSSDYTAEVTEGTTYGRFYISGRFRTPQIATDIDEVQGDEVRSTKAQKVLIEEKIYIMVGDKLYDATGKLVKGK